VKLVQRDSETLEGQGIIFTVAEDFGSYPEYSIVVDRGRAAFRLYVQHAEQAAEEQVWDIPVAILPFVLQAVEAQSIAEEAIEFRLSPFGPWSVG
jgi:hypothetical protein